MHEKIFESEFELNKYLTIYAPLAFIPFQFAVFHSLSNGIVQLLFRYLTYRNKCKNQGNQRLSVHVFHHCDIKVESKLYPGVTVRSSKE